MAIPIPQPHRISVVTPDENRDDDSGAGRLDYGSPNFGDAPATKRIVKGMFQSRGGSKVIADEGAEVPLDGLFFTKDQIVKENDILDVQIPGTSSKFLIVGIEAKYDTPAGKFSHNECSLVRELKR